MKWALYDLRFQPPSHDFITFCHYAKHYWAEGVWFIPGYNDQGEYLGEAGQQERFRTIVLPLARIYGLKVKFGETPRDWQWKDRAEEKIVYPQWATYSGGMTKYSHRFKLVHELKAPLPQKISGEAMDWANDRFKGRRPIVVSIRNAPYLPLRNSREAWYRWAADHNAEVIPDYLDEKISTERLIACYELASLNIGVHQGRDLLNWFSHRPYLVVKHIIFSYKVMNPKWIAREQGVQVGFQMPWATKAQKILWNSEDDYDTIEREYQTYLDENREVAG